MNHLTLYNPYSREDVCRIFAPNVDFEPSRGPWGMRGIVSIPNNVGDYVFFVTFGESQANHVFKEEIDENGILSWQSQPSQDFTSSQIKEFINHDYLVNDIHLFLRTKKSSEYGGPEPYCYMGLLAFHSVDESREKPVYFRWRLLNWDYYFLKQILKDLSVSETSVETGLLEVIPPFNKTRPRSMFNEKANILPPLRRNVDYGALQIENSKLGKLGELLVVEWEKYFLCQCGRQDLASQVEHVSETLGDGAGYDILSFDEYGNKKYIEVKTTKKDRTYPFYLSANEDAISRRKRDNYFLYRLFEYSEERTSAKFFVIQGDVRKQRFNKPTQYLVY